MRGGESYSTRVSKLVFIFNHMAEYRGKPAARGKSLSRRGSGIVFKDRNQEDRNVEYSSRLGCSSSRVGSTGDSQNGTPEKPKHARSYFRSMSGKAVAGTSSKQFSISISQRKSFQEQHNPALQEETSIAESSCRKKIDDANSSNEQVLSKRVYSDGRQGRKEVLQFVPKMNKNLKSSVFKEISTDMAKSSGSCSSASSSKVRKKINRQPSSGNQEASSSSFIPHSVFAPRKSTLAAKSSPQGLGVGVGAPRCGLKNLSCTSASDVFPSSYSSSNSIGDRRIDVATKRPSNGESSAATGRGSNTSFTGDCSGSTQAETSVPNIHIAGRTKHEPVSRRTRNRLAIRDGAVSARAQRNSPGDSRTKAAAEGSRISIPQPVCESSSAAFSVDLPRTLNALSGRPNSSNRATRSRGISCPEDRNAQINHVSLGDRHGYRHFNVEGVAEVLLALERIEQDEEIAYEQLLVLESNLLWGALRFNDQHRDMRMDIDNMSYEELLALEERMGTVSTALTEEQLSKCLKRSTFTSAFPERTVPDNDDVKCSICQEEYVVGDEVGRLPCEHPYHVACVHQWLRQKNWCPICKSSALLSQETT